MNSHDEQKESKTDFRRVFGTLFRRGFGRLDVAAAPENRRGIRVLMIGAAAVVVIAMAVGLSFNLRRPDAAKQPAPKARSSPGTRATPAPASANVQPPAKNTPPAPLAKHEAQTQPEGARPKREEKAGLSVGPSRISGARDNSAPMSDAPAISVGNVPARVLRQSELEPVTAIKKVAPVYPLVAEQHRLSGSVVVWGTVNKNGRIRDLQLISGSPIFRDAAFAAVKQWVFKPARLNGQAIEQSTTIRLDFGSQ